VYRGIRQLVNPNSTLTNSLQNTLVPVGFQQGVAVWGSWVRACCVLLCWFCFRRIWVLVGLRLPWLSIRVGFGLVRLAFCWFCFLFLPLPPPPPPRGYVNLLGGWASSTLGTSRTHRKKPGLCLSWFSCFLTFPPGGGAYSCAEAGCSLW
jgi:hypothetical protein